MNQINLKLPEKLFEAAKNYAETYGYKNIQELAAESMREKVFPNFDESFSEKEIALIDELITVSRDKTLSEEELNKTLLG